MSFLFRSKKDAASYEKTLAKISARLMTTERSLSTAKINSKWLHKRFYMLAFVFLVPSLLWIQLSTGFTYNLLFDVTKMTLLCGIPVFTYLLSRLVSRFYVSRIASLDARIETLKLEHAAALEELKKSTDFYATNALLNRFATGEDAYQILDEELSSKQKKVAELNEALNKLRDEHPGLVRFSEKNGDKWFDKFLDKLAGEEDGEALICYACFSHNGIAPNGKLDTKYKCPKSGKMNPQSKESSPSNHKEANELAN